MNTYIYFEDDLWWIDGPGIKAYFYTFKQIIKFYSLSKGPSHEYSTDDHYHSSSDDGYISYSQLMQ